MKKLTALILAVSMALSMAACGSAPAASTGSAATAEGSAAEGSSSGNVLNVMVEVEVQSLDPQVATDGTSFEVIANYTDGLMQMDADGQAVPAIAESYDLSEDGTTYTFHLREDANWSNGEPVTANDFVFAWQRAVDPELASEYSYMMSDIGQIKNAAEIIAGEMDKSELGVTAIDDKTLEVQLNVPVSYFLSLLYFPTYYPVNQAFFESCGDTFGTSPETVLSNGAFIMETYEPAATNFTLVKNENYYAADSVSVEGLNYQVIKDSQTALMSYQNGDLDIIQVSGDSVDQVAGDPELLTTGAGYLWYITLNLKDVEALNNLNIRKAMTMAIDRESIVTDVVKDGSKATYTAVPVEFATGPDGSDFSGDQTMFSDVCAYDPEQAATLWATGLSELGVDSVEVEMILDDPTEQQNVAAVLKEQLETTLPGLTINLKVEPKKQRVEDMQNGDFELGLTRWGPDYADPMTYLGMWVTDNANNYGFWSNEEYDAIIAECTTGDLCTDPEGRWAAMYDAEKLVMDEVVIIPLYTKSNANMIKSNVTGVDFHPVALNRVFKNAVKG